MGRRTATDSEPQAVYVWVCSISGKKGTTAAYARRRNAKTWIMDQLGHEGVWNECGTGVQARYDAGPNTGIVEMREVPDAIGIILPDPPTA